MKRIDGIRLGTGSGGFVPNPTIDYSVSYFFARGNTLVRSISNKLEISSDGGITFPKEVTLPTQVIPDELRLVHVFNDGDILVASHRQAFYTSNGIDWNESAYKNANGSNWTRSLHYDNFSPLNGQRPCVINGVDCLLFSNYNNNENQNVLTTPGKSYAWLSEDNGRTLKAIFSLGETICQNTGTTVTARHIHSATQDPFTGAIYMDTGDEDRNINSHWIKGVHNANNNTWTWTDLGTGHFRKTCGIHYDENYIYGVLDTENGGLIRYNRGQENNTANVTQLLTTINDCIGGVFGKNGDCLIHQAVWNASDPGNVLWYSPNKIDWTRIVLNGQDMPEGWDNTTTFIKSWQPMDNGKAFVDVQLRGTTGYHEYNFRPSVSLNAILAKYGFPNAFK